MIDESDVPGLDRLPEIFADCLDRTHRKVDRPIVEGAFLYSTNGSIVVRMPVPTGWDLPGPVDPARGIASAFQGRWETGPVTLPALSTAPCPECRGARLRPSKPCPACRGCLNRGIDLAYCECPRCSNGGRCPDCESAGSPADRACESCRQTGLAESADSIEVAPRLWVQRRYVALLRKHGATAHLPGDFRTRGDFATAPLRFVTKDAEGLVMPMT